MILVILLQYFCFCIYDIYLYIPICSIYVYEYAVYIYSRLYIWYATGTQVTFWG